MIRRTRLILGMVVLGMVIVTCVFIFSLRNSHTPSSRLAQESARVPDSVLHKNDLGTTRLTSVPANYAVDPEIVKLGADLTDESMVKLIPESIPMRMRIARDVNTLRHEDTATSVKMLSEVEMYYWPGYPKEMTMVRIPFLHDVGQWDVESILSNRRVLKILAECSKMSKKDAARIVRDELRAALAAYKLMFEAEWNSVLHARQDHPIVGKTQYGAGPSLQISNNPDHSPTLCGLRFKILSLMVVAGNLGLAEAKDEVAAVTKMAVEQRDQFYYSQEGTEADRYNMLQNAGIYNRQVLMTANYGMSSGSFGGGAWEQRRLTTFNSQVTPYDLLSRGGGPIPPDYSKGSISVWVHKPCGDQEFDEFMTNHK